MHARGAQPTDRALHALTQELTYLPETYGGEPEELSKRVPHILSNDVGLGRCYMEAAKLMPSPSGGKHAVALILGEAGIATANQLLPTALMVDTRPITLSGLQVEEIMQHAACSPEEFLDHMEDYVETSFNPALPKRSHVNIRRHYQDQAFWWRDNAPDGTPPYFLDGQEAYDTAQDGMGLRIYHQADMSDQEQVTRLGRQMTKAGVEVVLANFSNAYARQWAGYGVADMAALVVAHIPFTQGAVVISSDTHPYDTWTLSRAEMLEGWKARMAQADPDYAWDG